MSELIPTRVGDVLIEHKAGTLFHVGAVSWDGQQKLSASYDRLTSRPAALVAARNLVMSGGKIYLLNTIGQWRELQP